MDSDVFEIYKIISQKKYPLIYSYTSIILISIILIIYTILSYDYHTYYVGKGIWSCHNKECFLKTSINIEELDTITKNKKIEINKTKYNYTIAKIDNDKTINDNYQVLYLKIEDIDKTEKIEQKNTIKKKKQKIIYHILDYLERS